MFLDSHNTMRFMLWVALMNIAWIVGWVYLGKMSGLGPFGLRFLVIMGACVLADELWRETI